MSQLLHMLFLCLFVVNALIVITLVLLLSFIPIMNDFYNGKAKGVEPILNNYLSLSDESKSRLQHHKFLSPHRENCNTNSISSLNISENKGEQPLAACYLIYLKITQK